MPNKLNTSRLICRTLNSASWHSWKEAEERGFRDLPEGQAWGEATRDGNVAVWGGVQRYLRQSRTHFRPNPNPLSHSVISPYNSILRTCVSLCLTLHVTLHYPPAKFNTAPSLTLCGAAVRALFVSLRVKQAAPTMCFPTWLECFPVSLSLISTN